MSMSVVTPRFVKLLLHHCFQYSRVGFYINVVSNSASENRSSILSGFDIGISLKTCHMYDECHRDAERGCHEEMDVACNNRFTDERPKSHTFTNP